MTIVDDAGPEPENLAPEYDDPAPEEPKEEAFKDYLENDTSDKAVAAAAQENSIVHTHRRSTLMERPAFSHCRRIYNFPDYCPRCCSICVVIILPLWFLVLVSIVSGHFLAQMEAPGEVESNDAQLASRASLISELNHTYRIIDELPRICYDAYEDRGIIIDGGNNNITDKNATFEDIWDYIQADLVEYMNNCTNATQGLIDRVFDGLKEAASYQPDQLTFNWIRCSNKTAIPGRKSWLKPSQMERDAVKLANQTVYFTTIWEQQQEAYYYEYLGDDNLDPTQEEQAKAFAYSISLATGDQDCDPNSQGTAWFWFTVMTTVGYGNQAPQTSEGRLFTAMLGFLCILAFASILASAGYISLIIFDDLVTRCKLNILAKPRIACPFWGLTWVAWMSFIGAFTKTWWSRRADFDVSAQESWWFAYISTTTVGLGDFYLQPSVIFVDDLLIFTLMFLTGFVFLSTFLEKLRNLASAHCPDYAATLRQRLDKSNLFYYDDDKTTKQKAEKEQRVQHMEALEKLAQSTEEDPTRELSNVFEEEQILFLLLRDAKTRRRRLEEVALSQGTAFLDLDDIILQHVLVYLDRQSLAHVAPCCKKLRNLSVETALGLP